ncbi:MAG: hypothetical protein AVDCRST_MAG57-3135 [uncultured Blastococcus sp.]|uniref:Uncharacterized protein n=1 Tax=uncultured Blastococcus sp. TaxID=217144 RepID=A0A6J4J210_9ACTN|nr:MAG: hypothetical protein AVDCRST_MAG57-3135 [uncultured Blastococcus sp.]
MSQPLQPPVEGPGPSAPQPAERPSSEQAWSPPAAQPDTTGWAVPPSSPAPVWQPPGSPSASQQAGPLQRGGLLLALAAAAGLLAGLLGGGLVAAVLFAGSAADVGREIADQIGPAVEQGIVDGQAQAMEESLDGTFSEDYSWSAGEPIPLSDQFPPTPPVDLGSDPIMDGYAQLCFEGDLQACDDLYTDSPPMSLYERYATTCGGRVKEYTAAVCTDLE